MKTQVQRISHDYAQILSRWPNVSAVLVGEAAETETLDPYFIIDLFVFYEKELPDDQARCRALGDPAAFETVPQEINDRFLVDALPVSISYYQQARIEALLTRAAEPAWVLRESGTVMLYRVGHGEIAFSAGDWLTRMRKRSLDLPDRFWASLKDSSRRAFDMELRHIGAAVHRGDNLFFLASSWRFSHAVLSFLFAHNRRFELSGRQLYEQMSTLQEVPDGFLGRFQSVLRQEGELSMGRKREVAELIARSLLPLA